MLVVFFLKIMHFLCLETVHDDNHLLQVVACTFVYDDWKTKNSPDAEAKADNDSDVQPTEKSSIPGSAGLKDPSEDIAPNSETSVLTLRCPGMTDPNTEIGLAHG